MNEELSHHFPIQPNEDLHFVGTGQPLGGWRFPFGEAIAPGLTVPWDCFIMDKLAFAVPERGPLRAGGHLIIGKHCTHISDWVLKNGRSSELIKVCAVKRELKWTDYRIGIGRHFAFE